MFLLNLALGGLAWIWLLLAAASISVIAYLHAPRAIKAFLWMSSVFLGLGIVTLATKIGVSVRMWQSSGFWYGELTFMLVVPLLLPSLIGVAFWSVPRLMRLLRTKHISPKLQSVYTEPRLVVPVQLAAVGSFYAVLALLSVRTMNYIVVVAVGWVLMAVIGWFLWLGRVRPRRRRLWRFALNALATVGVCGVLIGVFALVDAYQSKLPASYTMAGVSAAMNMNDMDHHAMMGTKAISVASLTEKDLAGPIVHYDLTAQETEITLSSGKKQRVLSFNGQVPGPALQAHEGDILEVRLINALPEENVTLHWHGLDVPNAEDGVPGLTQDAVRPGKSFTYRFKLRQTGTYWYHSHEQSSEQVMQGLFGSLAITPKRDDVVLQDKTFMYHEWKDGTASLGQADTLQRDTIAAGTKVRLRVVNTSNGSTPFVLYGAPFVVAAIDGNAVNQPGQLVNTRVRIPAGGKRDIIFTMPATPVFFGKADGTNISPHTLGVSWSTDGLSQVAHIQTGPELDLLHYGVAAHTDLTSQGHYDKTYKQYFDPRIGFFDGKLGVSYAVNGTLFPDTPPIMVNKGDKVKVTFYNRSPQAHPMHLHGHQMLVLSRNGIPASGSPWWTDTLDVQPGDSYTVAFTADNPGLWMDHCHNLEHAAGGMIMHVMYAGYSTPYLSGPATGNVAE